MLTALMNSSPVASAAALFALLLAANLRLSLRSCRGTTLAAPCVWAMISATCLALITALEALSPAQTITSDALRFAAAASTFCPLMAVLGAKRPQDRGWQWIVLSLWAVAVWPAVQAVLIPSGTQLELFIVWKLFLLGLVAVGLLNYLPTRFACPALLVAVGQLILLDGYLWSWNLVPNQFVFFLAIVCFCAAQILVVLLSKRAEPSLDSSDATSLEHYEQLWLRFRNAFGAFWGLRILARVNETAQLRDWPFRLTWAGFESHPLDSNETPNETQLAELDQTLATLLRRFNKIADDQSS